MAKVVINGCYGGFGVSGALFLRAIKKGYTDMFTVKLVDTPEMQHEHDWAINGAQTDRHSAELDGIWSNGTYAYDPAKQLLYSLNDHGYSLRTNAHLIELVEEMRAEEVNPSGDCASIYVVEIPDDVKWYISEYDGSETVEEEHRSWS